MLSCLLKGLHVHDQQESQTAMPEAQSWRELLGTIIKNPQEKQRIARALGVNPLTLTRWVQNASTPRSHTLSKLLEILPEHRAQLMALLPEALEESSTAAVDEVAGGIPATFYERVLRTAANLPPSLHFWSLSDLIMHQALEQLDPYRQGMAVIVAQCMPPSTGRLIRSLREVIGRGTPPWSLELEHKATLLGTESLAGHAISTGRLQYQQDLTKEGLLPFRKTPWEQSAL